MSWIITPGFSFDTDAAGYIAAVEAADGEALETGTRYAIDNFVIGCKQDGIWNAIKASCILAGARTLAGALVPLKGAAPTNLNFVSGDYNRKTGLKGNGTTKYLNSNRKANVDPLDSHHLAAYLTVARTTGTYLSGELASQRNSIGGTIASLRSGGATVSTGVNSSGLTGLMAAARASSSSVSYRFAGNSGTVASASVIAPNENIAVFARIHTGSADSFCDGRFAFYSIGESLDLAKLDTRVTALITAIGAAIP